MKRQEGLGKYCGAVCKYQIAKAQYYFCSRHVVCFVCMCVCVCVCVFFFLLSVCFFGVGALLDR